VKNVWILNHYAMTPNSPGGTRHFHLAKYLREFGWNATLIAASTELNSNVQRLERTESSRLEFFSEIPFLWIRTPAYKGNGGGRILNMMTYAFRVIIRNNTSILPKPDVIVGSSVHLLAALSGLILARRFNVPFVFEVRDLWPLTLVSMGRLRKGSILTYLLRKLEVWLYHNATRIVVLLPMAVDYIANLNIPLSRIVWIPNGVDLSLFSNINSVSIKKGGPFILMYFGAHGQANDLGTVLNAMKIIQDNEGSQHIILRMIGDGPLKQALVSQSQQLGLKNVIFEPSVPKYKIPELAANADAFVIAVLALPDLYKYGISMNKLYDYLAAGHPIVLASGAVNNPVEEAGAGLTVLPHNPVALAEAILNIAGTSVEKRNEMGRAGQDYVKKNHDFVILAERFATVLNESVLESR
jgi:glycosyltransferase involved in cell wall biosynthesis